MGTPEIKRLDVTVLKSVIKYETCPLNPLKDMKETAIHQELHDSLIGPGKGNALATSQSESDYLSLPLGFPSVGLFLQFRAKQIWRLLQLTQHGLTHFLLSRLETANLSSEYIKKKKKKASNLIFL